MPVQSAVSFDGLVRRARVRVGICNVAGAHDSCAPIPDYLASSIMQELLATGDENKPCAFLAKILAAVNPIPELASVMIIDFPSSNGTPAPVFFWRRAVAVGLMSDVPQLVFKTAASRSLTPHIKPGNLKS